MYVFIGPSLQRLMRNPDPLSRASTSAALTQSKSPGIECFKALGLDTNTRIFRLHG